MLLNIAGYRFADLDALPERRDALSALGHRLELRGTVLLAPEGLNVFACGTESAVRELLAALRSDPALAELTAKESWSQQPSFGRWRVRLKREIITFRRPGLRPQQRRAHAVTPAVLSRWLAQGRDDDGRPLAMIDTRNRFEVDAGSFDGALDLSLHSFTDLPAAVEARRAELSGQRLVTFCTGGIRCEKAALWMAEAGFKHVTQLDGGILNWFEQQGGAHWRGSCVVFDRREALRPDLSPERDGPPPAAA
ncbi:MAG: rhodanese-like domain-containing protein [Burkholderiaceae bacterium]